MGWLSVSPLLISALTAIFAGISYRLPLAQKIFHFLGSFALLVSVCLLFYQLNHVPILVLQLGGYSAPFGISIVIDKFSSLMLLITGLVTFCVAIYGLTDLRENEINRGFYSAFWLLLCGVCGAFSTGDLFNLYVWFEVMLIAVLTMLVIGGQRAQFDAALKYALINLVTTILMLTAIALLYGLTGTLNMADLAVRLAEPPQLPLASIACLLLLLAFAMKAALFPFYFWLPASYHTANTTSIAIFAALLTKVGIYALIRLVTLLFPHQHYFLVLLLVLAGLTMVSGVLGAAAEYHLQRILSFHIISQIGYVVMGLAFYTPFALACAIFFMFHNMLVKTNLFLISGITSQVGQSHDVRQLGGFYQSSPFLAFLFLISAFSLAGFPPFSGFWGKFLLFSAGVETHHLVMVFIALLVSFVTLYSMVKIWNQVFWKSAHESVKENALVKTQKLGLFPPIILLTGFSLFMGFVPNPIFNTIQSATEQMMQPEIYTQAVLGKN